MKRRTDYLEVAKEVLAKRYPEADSAFVAGSITRNEETQYSDIDLVVVFNKLENAHRESFVFEGWPVEAFVHDPETMNYFFFESDAKSGHPVLPRMVAEGIVIPATTALSAELKALANKVIKTGPPKLTESEFVDRRYFITDLVDDIRAPRSQSEALATGTKLYEILGDFYLRAQGLWSGSGKGLARSISNASPTMAKQLEHAFSKLFSGDSSAIVKIAEDILKPYGGFYFEGYIRVANKERRKKLSH